MTLSFFYDFPVFLQHLGKSIVEEEHGQGGGNQNKIYIWYKTRENIKTEKQRTISLILFIPVFFGPSRKSIIGKQHGQGGGKWGLINLRHESRTRKN